jgi:uncharacterized RDD family membrane protein YckC
LVSQPIPQPSWKEEVNRRLEAHKSRRGISVVEDRQDEEQSSVSDRAAQAAARVAARFSRAPSYSEMQAAEARSALRAAEAATRAALEAQAAAQVALANLQTAEEERAEPFVQQAAPRWEPEPEPPMAAATSWKVRWEPDFPVRTSEAPRDSTDSTQPQESAAPEKFQNDFGITTVDAQPIHANLIHFPREIVATRRMRPRLATSAEDAAQLSIFEVDPTTVSTEPMVGGSDASALEPSWAGPEWSTIELGAHPQHEPEAHHEPAAERANKVHLAPLELRLMAASVDLTLVLMLVCGAVFSMAGHLKHAPAMKVAEISAVAGFILMALAYQAFFLLTAGITPGMKYAGIAMCTFDDEYPTRKQLRDRMIALSISLLPVGLGMAWAIFDEDHLCWHDRLSRTYQRKC